jgi:hypothetical protein
MSQSREPDSQPSLPSPRRHNIALGIGVALLASTLGIIQTIRSEHGSSHDTTTEHTTTLSPESLAQHHNAQLHLQHLLSSHPDLFNRVDPGGPNVPPSFTQLQAHRHDPGPKLDKR